MRLSKALVQTGFFKSRIRAKQWIKNNKISLNGERLKKDVELSRNSKYAIELHGNKINGKYILDAPIDDVGKYIMRGPIK